MRGLFVGRLYMLGEGSISLFGAKQQNVLSPALSVPGYENPHVGNLPLYKSGGQGKRWWLRRLVLTGFQGSIGGQVRSLLFCSP